MRTKQETPAETPGAIRAGGALTWPIALPFLRIALVVLAALATAGVLAGLGQPSGPAAVWTFSTLYLLPVNLVSLLLVRRLVHREGSTLRAMIGFDRGRVGRDILWGLLWIAVLYLPFAGAIVGTMFALFGTAAFESFDAVFAPAVDQLPFMDPTVAIVLGLVAVLTFAPINAPTEELVYRGYSQGRLAAWPVASVLLPSLAFGLQHVFFATTVPGMVVYAVAFFVWGLGSALIYRRQGRLVPLIVAHFIVNLLTSLPALIVPFVAG
jgi:membrane protease YdiL (CAAX protease family)